MWVMLRKNHKESNYVVKLAFYGSRIEDIWDRLICQNYRDNLNHTAGN